MTGPDPQAPLPELRPELTLLAGPVDTDGRPSWLIHDSLSNRFAQIDPPAYEALKHWPACATVADLIETVNADGRATLDLEAATALVDFLYAHQLTVTPRTGGWESFAQSRRAQAHSFAGWLLHNYLFFRVPLVRPHAFLVRTLPRARMLWSPAACVSYLVMGLAGLYLTSRQWDAYVGTLVTYFNWEGAALAGAAIVVVKIAHELGHAYAATAFGCRVHTMGIAFVVMAPMPYTDVTDAWRLTDRRKRLIIDAAGIMAEAAIAMVALCVWAFLPEGPLRSVAFIMSAVSIASSLAINLNPFMRFDGYYLLSEMLGVENLQTRAFALGRWRLREWLFGLGAPCPEKMAPHRISLLVAYAWIIWIYRLVLFVGIAVLVYQYFFKVLGILLFAVEILYFVARPIAGELRIWWRMRATIAAAPRTRYTAAVAALAVVTAVLPWSTAVEIPAVMEVERLQMIYPVRNAQLAALHVSHGAKVKAGEPIATLVSADIENDITQVEISLRLAMIQYSRRMVDAADKSESLVLESSIRELRTRIAGLLRERGELIVRAPFAGHVVELNPELSPGRWLSPRDLLAIVAGGEGLVARGYASEADVGRITEGAAASFVPEHAGRAAVPLRVERIATAGAAQIDIPDLASIYGGKIGVTPDERRRLVPSSSNFLVTFKVDHVERAPELSVRGVVVADGQAESAAGRLWRRALGVLLRESGA